MTGWAEIVWHAFSQNRSDRRATIFYYHRIADIGSFDRRVDDRSVPPALFEQQIAALKNFAEVVPLTELPERLDQKVLPNEKPLVSLTFDDGFANFHLNALPVIKRYEVPVTLSVVTGWVGSLEVPPFDDWAVGNAGRVSPETWRIMNWQELEDCVRSGLVTIGSHSHSHPKGNHCSPSQLREEVGRSAEILLKRFGKEHTRVFAYPFGNSLLGHVPQEYETAVRDAGFSIGVTTDVGLVHKDTNILRLPRLEAHNQDSPATLRAKSAGAIAPLYLNARFHSVLAMRSNRSLKAGTGMDELNFQGHHQDESELLKIEV